MALAALGFLWGRIGGRRQQLYPAYAEHIREALETFQKALAGDIPGVGTDEYVENGILAPARHWLRQAPDEDVRLMVLGLREPDRREFRLVWESGHSLEARQKFRLEVGGSFVGHAYESGQTQWTNDVESDPRWRPHPRARPERAYGSLVAVPLRAGNDIIGVLSVLSTVKGAFTPGDLKYVEILGSLINVVWGVVDTGDETQGD